MYKVIIATVFPINLPENAFAGNTWLTHVEIQGSGSIGAGAFSGCSNLTTVKIYGGISGIGESAFAGCTALNQIFIPASVAIIGANAFRYCSSALKIITDFLSKPSNWDNNWNSSNCDVFWRVSLGGAQTIFSGFGITGASRWTGILQMTSSMDTVHKNAGGQYCFANSQRMNFSVITQTYSAGILATISGTITFVLYKAEIRLNVVSYIPTDISHVVSVTVGGSTGMSPKISNGSFSIMTSSLESGRYRLTMDSNFRVTPSLAGGTEVSSSVWHFWVA